MILWAITYLRRLIAASLRRSRSPRRAAGAALLLAILFVEPLLCVFHCQLWLPALLVGQASAHVIHQHGAAPHEALAGQGAASSGAAAHEGGGCPEMRPGPAREAPYHVPPSPVHEMTLALGLALAVTLLAMRSPAPAPLCFASLSLPPPLRPPILSR